jgi:ligand-binding SRPBCC domain-containing protein
VNLAKITPSGMNFRIVYNSGSDQMFAGQLIHYRINVIPLITTTWVTEITHVERHRSFVDEQRDGPYSLWHHRHQFIEKSSGVEMTDDVNYAIPFGIIGRMANTIFVERMVNAIFDHRFEAIQKLFPKKISG